MASLPGQVFDNLFEVRDGSVRVKAVSIPLGSDPSKPSVKVEIGQFSVERARVGVFRIGILPQPVFQDVRIRVMHDSGQLWANDLRGFFEREQSISRAKIRGLSLVGSDGKRLLHAKEAVIQPGAKSIELSGIVSERLRLPRTGSSSARLWLDGAKAGRLELLYGKEEIIDIMD